MKRTTFFVAEVCGPTMRVPSGNNDAAEWEMYMRASTIRAGHRAGAWKRESLERLAQRAGIVITRAYWCNYSDRHGYRGAVEHSII